MVQLESDYDPQLYRMRVLARLDHHFLHVCQVMQ